MKKLGVKERLTMGATALAVKGIFKSSVTKQHGWTKVKNGRT